MQRRWKGIIGSLALAAVTTTTARGAEHPIFDVPCVPSISLDGKSDDWGKQGFRVEVIQSLEGAVKPVADLDVRFRLGWDDRGLLVLADVRDDKAYEKNSYPWENDSLELFVAAKHGSSNFYQTIVTPGRGGEEPRQLIEDRRPTAASPIPLTAEVRRTTSASGYVVEALLPWKSLDLKPKAGDEVAFQLYANDSDGPGDHFQAVWYPLNRTHESSLRMHRLRLAARPSPPVRAAASGVYERLRRTRVRVNAVAGAAGKPVEVRDGRRTLGKGKLTENELSVLVDGQRVAGLALPSADQQRARALMEAELRFRPFVFTGTAFPPVDFAEPSLIEDVIGPYTIKTTFYDREYSPVKTAEKPGRYGAVIEIVPETGRPIRRYRTVFRMPAEVPWWNTPLAASLALPKSAGVEPEVLQTQRQTISTYLSDQFFRDAIGRDPRTAQLLAGLHETSPGAPPARRAEDVWAQDRQWWVGLKRRLNGANGTSSEPFVCPRPVNGQRAPELREGTAAQAGMKPDAVEKIDAVCRQWAADSDEGFAVCLARRGTVFFHKAYGQRDSRLMTVADKSYMASISKLLAGTQMLMVVDQGLVELDAPVEKYLPALRGIKVKRPLTVRHLLTHTAGLWGHWGDDLHDFEEIVADYYPYLEVGERYEYNGASFALAGKVIEAVTGEAMPRFSARHLFDPLGCTNIDMLTMSWATYSAPMDMAKIGQMLLNRGAYGSMRFFSEKTFQELLPRPLSEKFGPAITPVYGLGTNFYPNEGLGKGTYGHGAASSATLRIDPANELIIVMTRNSAGRNYENYHPQFLKAIVEGLATGS
jgi:CubicO group peptidase (beta-lactamase class C family)